MKALVLLSGGIDSAVCLWWSRRQRWELSALTVDYHERPAAETRAVRDLCGRLDVQLFGQDACADMVLRHGEASLSADHRSRDASSMVLAAAIS